MFPQLINSEKDFQAMSGFSSKQVTPIHDHLKIGNQQKNAEGPKDRSRSISESKIESLKSNKDYQDEARAKNFSPLRHDRDNSELRRGPMKPLYSCDIQSTETLRIKEYKKLCELVSKFEKERFKQSMKTQKPEKELGYYAKKKGFSIKTKADTNRNIGFLNQLKSRTSMGIVRWDPKKSARNKIHTVKSITQKETCFSESPKRRRDSDGQLITPDVGMATTDFFKKLVNITQQSSNTTQQVLNLDPNQKKEMVKKVSKKKFYMMPLEIKQLKNALQKEDTLQRAQSQFLIQDFSKIQGDSIEVELPQHAESRISLMNNAQHSMSLSKEFQSKKKASQAFNNLSPRLKDLLSENKDLLKKILIKDNTKLKEIIQQQKKTNRYNTEKSSVSLYKSMLKEAVRSHSKLSIPKDVREDLQKSREESRESSTENIKLDASKRSISLKKNLQSSCNEEQQIDIIENLGYHFDINAIDNDPSGNQTIKMKKFLKGYEDYTIDDSLEEEKIEESYDDKTKLESSTIYSEFQQAVVEVQDATHIQADLTDFLIRSIAIVDNKDISMKKNKSKFAQVDKKKVASRQSETSVCLTASEFPKILPSNRSRTSILKVEEEGKLHLIDESNSFEMEALDVDEISKICAQLDYCLMPVFSGNNVDPLINRLDTKRLDLAIEKKKYDSFKKEIYGVFDNKASMLASTKTSRPASQLGNISLDSSRVKHGLKITDTDKDVIDKYIKFKDLLEIKKMTKIFIEVRECYGIVPEAREKATISMHKDQLYIFGGTGSQKFNYFNKFDFHKQRWEKLHPKNSVKTDLPAERFGHTMCVYKGMFILFGGCGAFSEKTKMHESFKDIRIFHLKNFEWEIPDYYTNKSYKHFEPDKRMFHTAAVYGPMMLINGGINEETSEISDKIHIYDINNKRWIGSTVTNQDSKKNSLPRRYMHSMTAVVNSKIDQKTQSSMALLVQSFKAKLAGEAISYEKMGLYIFGGLDESDVPTNDLFHLRICQRETNDIYDNKKEDFYEGAEPRIYMELKKIEAAGAPPLPRYMHTTENIGKYLCIFGGKNDSIFPQTRNTALNDLHMYDISLNKWITVAIYGYLPMSRWGHCSTVYQNQMVIFGGKNLDTYANGDRLYFVQLDSADFKIRETKNQVLQLREFAKGKFKAVV